MGCIDLKTEVPGPRSRAVFEERRRHVAPGPFHTTPIVAERAEGATITDVDGNTFLDFACGIGVANLGHSEPSVVAAAKAQADKFFHTSINVVAYEGYVDVARRLNERAPGDFAKKTFLANSGAEAVENAIKFARAFTKRQAVICFEHAFHGRTYMAMAFTRAGSVRFRPKFIALHFRIFTAGQGWTARRRFVRGSCRVRCRGVCALRPSRGSPKSPRPTSARRIWRR